MHGGTGPPAEREDGTMGQQANRQERREEAARTIERALAELREQGQDGMAEDLGNAVAFAVSSHRQEGFAEGVQFAAQTEQRVAREALAQYVLEVLGKDAADGEIDLGALGKHYAQS